MIAIQNSGVSKRLAASLAFGSVVRRMAVILAVGALAGCGAPGNGASVPPQAGASQSSAAASPMPAQRLRVRPARGSPRHLRPSHFSAPRPG
jgi:predicted small lipoprotein YifL